MCVLPSSLMPDIPLLLGHLWISVIQPRFLPDFSYFFFFFRVWLFRSLLFTTSLSTRQVFRIWLLFCPLPFWLPLHACLLSRSVVSNSLRPHGPWPTRFLCPRDSPGKNTGVGCCALLQGAFLTQGLSLSLFMAPALAGWLFTTSNTWEALTLLYSCL